MSRVSVVIPVKDDSAMLTRCLGALGNQTRPADEIIVVDNASSDDSAEVARRFGATVLVESRAGIWAAAATGFDAASGQIIARLDADTMPPPDWLERIEHDLEWHPDAVAVSGRGRFYDLGPIARVVADVVYMRMYFVVMRLALGNAAVFGSNFAMRSSLWADVAARVHREDSEVHDDIDLSYHIHPAQRVLVDRELLVGISGRPFTNAGSMAVRIRRAAHTTAIHGLREAPPLRWVRRALGRQRRAVLLRDQPEAG